MKLVKLNKRSKNVKDEQIEKNKNQEVTTELIGSK